MRRAPPARPRAHAGRRWTLRAHCHGGSAAALPRQSGPRKCVVPGLLEGLPNVSRLIAPG